MKIKIIVVGFFAVCVFSLTTWKGHVGRKGAGVTVNPERVAKVTPSRQISHSRESRSVDELRQSIDGAIDTWNVREFTESELEALRSEFISGWSVDEVEAVSREWMIDENGGIIVQRTRGPDRLWRREMWVDVLFRRWGSLSPERALEFVKKFEDEAWVQTQTFDDTWAMNTPLLCAGKRFSAVIVGWSARDPFAAYRALLSGQAGMADAKILAQYYPETIRGIFENLGRADPYFALAEFRGNNKVEMRAKMLEGIAEALPLNYDYQFLFEDLRSEVGVDENATKIPLRGRLLSRWLESDPEEVETWYRSADADWLLPVNRRDTLKVEDEKLLFDWDPSVRSPFLFETPLASALSYWFARSPDDAIVWLQGHPEFVPPILAGAWNIDESADIKVSDRRRLLVLTLTQTERDRYILSPYGEQQFSDLVESYTAEESLKNLSALQLSISVEEKLAQKYLRENPDPFAPDDPFGSRKE